MDERDLGFVADYLPTITWLVEHYFRADVRGLDRIPDEPVLSRETYYGRGAAWPHTTELVAPNYVCYGRLLFQQTNMERYGWDLGILSPVISGAEFFFDVFTLPYHVATAPWRCYESSAGYCLPGDPVPLLLYPPELSLTGLAAEAAVVTGLVFIFP